MVLFPLYAILVWSFSWRFRRSWIAFAAVAVGVLGVVLVGMLHRLSGVIFPTLVNARLFSMLLGVEGACILVVGFYIALLPRQRIDLPCRRCGYELSGLDEPNPVCPECGLPHAVRRVKPKPCRGCGAVLFVARGDNPSCAHCHLDHAAFVPSTTRTDHAVVVFERLVAALHPRTSRYTTPSPSTPKGKPRIIVRRNPDNTFSSIG